MTPSLALLLVIASATLGSMGAYAVGARRRPSAAGLADARRFGGGDFLVQWLLWALSPAEALFLRLGATPDAFNIAGLSFGLAGGVSIGMGKLEVGGWAIALGGLCDVLDGRIARARGLASAYGKFMDSTLDRFGEAFAFLGFVVYLRQTPYGAFLAAASLAGSLLVSYAQARGETVGVVGAGGLMQRAERLVLMCLVCLADAPVTARFGRPGGTLVLWMLTLMSVTTFGTAVYRTLWIGRRLRP